MPSARLLFDRMREHLTLLQGGGVNTFSSDHSWYRMQHHRVARCETIAFTSFPSRSETIECSDTGALGGATVSVILSGAKNPSLSGGSEPARGNGSFGCGLRMTESREAADPTYSLRSSTELIECDGQGVATMTVVADHGSCNDTQWTKNDKERMRLRSHLHRGPSPTHHPSSRLPPNAPAAWRSAATNASETGASDSSRAARASARWRSKRGASVSWSSAR